MFERISFCQFQSGLIAHYPKLLLFFEKLSFSSNEQNHISEKHCAYSIHKYVYSDIVESVMQMHVTAGLLGDYLQ